MPCELGRETCTGLCQIVSRRFGCFPCWSFRSLRLGLRDNPAVDHVLAYDLDQVNLAGRLREGILSTFFNLLHLGAEPVRPGFKRGYDVVKLVLAEPSQKLTGVNLMYGAGKQGVPQVAEYIDLLLLKLQLLP